MKSEAEEQSNKNVVMVGWDGDGCVFPLEYYNYLRTHYGYNKNLWKYDDKVNAAIRVNQSLLEHVKNKIALHRAVSVGTFIFSNRQSYGNDKLNQDKGGSASFFPVHLRLSAELKKLLNQSENEPSVFFADRFLLTDITAGCIPGQSFQRATRASAEEIEHARYFFDPTKMTIVYAQIHRWALVCPAFSGHFSLEISC